MIENLVFGRSGLNSRVFEKLFISYSCIIFIKHCAWEVSALKCSVFQKIVFSRFLIDRTCCLTDRNCNKKLGLNLPGSIASRLMLDRSNVIFNRLNLIFDRLKIVQRVFKNKLFHVFFTISKFSKSYSLSLSSTDPDSSPLFVIFLPNFSQGFCLVMLVRPLYPFFFSLFTLFMHF